MDTTEILDSARLWILVVLLVGASILDLRTRKVDNRYWMSMAILGLVLLVAKFLLEEKPFEYLLVVIPISAILFDVYFEPSTDSPLAKIAPAIEYGAAFASILILAYLWGDTEYFQHLLGVPVMMMVIVLFYILDIVRGGADAKALISISIVFPFYPALGPFPLLRAEDAFTEVFFPFSFIVLVTAAIIVALLPIGFALKNLAAKEFEWPYALLGYKMDLSSASGKHIWLMERMQDGQHIVYTRPRRDEDLGKELQKLRDTGRSRIWVTPKIPFIPAILAGSLITALVGNLLLLIFAL